MTLKVGFGHTDLTPPLPFPLAGVVVKGGREATRVRDPLFARAMAVCDGERTICLVSVDLLTFHGALSEAVRSEIAAAGVQLEALLLTATHTHSAPGGYWDTPSTVAFMGPPQRALFDHLVQGIAAAAITAAGDLRPARLAFGETAAPALNWNRRHPAGAIDDTVSVLRVERDDGLHRVVSFGAHPVIVSEHDPLTASADFPGEIVRALSSDGGGAIYVSGSLGGVSPLWPDHVHDAEAHLALVRDALLARIRVAEAGATPVVGESVAGATVVRRLKITTPRLFPSRWRLLDLVALPARLWLRRFMRRGLGEAPAAPVTVLRIGDLIIAGFPADMGPDVGLAARAVTSAAGYRLFAAASHSNDFVGYVHLPAAYEQPPTRGEDYAFMTIYENAMAACGRDVGRGFVEQLREALSR